MEDPDYQMALNLQRMYQQEARTEGFNDQNLARKLQAEFEQEINIEKPTNHLVYTKNKNKDNTKSLVDPSWELVDPTPNIYNLFLAFNQQFFWNKLLAVCVDWSKRMTTCAGICSYDGRGGMCKIALSEPLLKLRPRKDLIETLLHEMIHAYLFVTHNNRDRDGHGPEFHKHMYRINNEAGTNITVYHSFHDEVNLYKTHWWKCNGPCVSRKPYYGIIRRATNRAPGPRDFWWGEHSRTCGGQFIKIKEPEKPEKKKNSEKENVKPKSKPQNQPGIKSFLPTSKSVPAHSTPSWSNPKPQELTNVAKTTNPMIPRTNIHGFGSTSSSSSNNKAFNNNANIKNIHGFHDIDKISQKAPVKGGVSMNAGTIVINKKPGTSTDEISPKNGNQFYGSGFSLNASTSRSNVGSSLKSPNTDLSAVRNHWLNKFENKDKVSSRKRVSDEMIQNTPKRKQNMAKCPNCNIKVEESQINEHLDICLNLTETCNYCNEEINAIEIDKHKLTCPKKSEKKSQELVECHICCEFFDSTEIETHLQSCLQNISMSFETSKDFKECEICKSNIDESIYNTHVASCLNKFYDDIEKSLKSPEKVSCLVCKKSIPKDSLDSHLEDCMSDTVFQNPEEQMDFCNDNSLIEEYNKNISCSIVISDDSEVFDNEDELNSFINDNSLIEDYEKSFSS